MTQEKPGYMSETAILKKLQCFYPSTFHCVFEKIARNIGKNAAFKPTTCKLYDN